MPARVYALVDALPPDLTFATVLDADGRPLRAMGRIAIIGRRLGVLGTVIDESGGLVHLHFRNKAEAWFRIEDPLQ